MYKGAPKHGLDPILLLAVIGLVLFGLIAVASASSVLATKFRTDNLFYFRHQLLFGGTVGLAFFLTGIFVPYRWWRNLALPGLIAALILLLLVFVPIFKVSYGGASRWIDIGPITIQPTEVTKLAFIVYLAALLEAKGADIKSFRKSVVPFLVITGLISILIILQPDMGTLLTILIAAGAMIFAAGLPIRFILMLLFGGIASFLVMINTAGYRMNRIMVYLHPELDPKGIGYQINQALLAVGSGGFWGLGFGRSRQKFQYLPEPAGDSIFAIIAEELGFVRSSLIVGIFALVAWRGFRIARLAPDTFGRLLAVGITSWIVAQTFINIGSILAVTPLTGIPLPFISYGGTSLGSLLLASGVLLNISRYTAE